MAKRKKTIGEKLDQIVEEAEKEPEELPRFSTDAEAGFVDDTKEENEKPDIREIARRAVIEKGIDPTEQRITDYIERFNLA